MDSKWFEPLLQCAEGMYILEEETKKVVWTSARMTKETGSTCVGEYCWKAFLGKTEPCHFCPALTEDDPVYTWEYFEAKAKHWLMVKHKVFRRDGILYRAGNLNSVDDMMRLNYETVQEVVELQTQLTKSRGETVTATRGAVCDLLTGVLNRNCFQLDLEREYANVAGLGVLYFDLNNLKKVNDKFRHAAGDDLLRRTADVLRRICGHMKHARCYRIGGDEFVMLLVNCKEQDLNRCKKLFYSYLDMYNHGERHACQVAVGAAFSKEICDPEELISKADREMYNCKKQMKEEA